MQTIEIDSNVRFNRVKVRQDLSSHNAVIEYESRVELSTPTLLCESVMSIEILANYEKKVSGHDFNLILSASIITSNLS